jgi:hypothetical protein
MQPQDPDNMPRLTENTTEIPVSNAPTPQKDPNATPKLLRNKSLTTAEGSKAKSAWSTLKDRCAATDCPL